VASHEVTAILETQEVCRFFRPGSTAEVRALENVSLSIPQGSFTVLTGPSGSGKTTLLALLGALDRPTRGQVFFQGQELGRCSEGELARVRRRVGFVFQDFSLIAGLSVEENITYPLIPRGVRRAMRHERARRLLERLGLADKLSRRPPELSGGEQQRVAVARALAGQPQVLLADEPACHLDPAAGKQLLKLFEELHAEGTTIVLATHDPSLMAQATRLFVLEAGRIQRSDS
jgi:ABC-type lipoprotein export system ATPase subunit